MYIFSMTTPFAAAEIMTAGCRCFRARRVARALTRIYDEALRPHGIQATKLTLLTAIEMSDPGVSMTVLAEIFALDQTTLSRNLRPLMKSGVVETLPQPTDRPVRVVRLTAAGRRMVEDDYPSWCQAHERVLHLLGAEAAGELRSSLGVVAAAMRTPASKGTR